MFEILGLYQGYKCSIFNYLAAIHLVCYVIWLIEDLCGRLTANQQDKICLGTNDFALTPVRAVNAYATTQILNEPVILNVLRHSYNSSTV